MKLLALAAVMVAGPMLVQAACPNSCSGRGTCGTNDQCTCYHGFRGNSCEDRVCPYGKAWATTPQGDLNFDKNQNSATVYLPGAPFTDRTHVVTPENAGGTWEMWPSFGQDNEGHFEMECSNAGLCNKELGQCQCFQGFEGAACDRMTCPGGNYCNGHGRCLTIAEQLAEKNAADGTSITYTLWDADMTRTCSCDPGYTGIGCTERICPKGDDPLTKTHQIDEVQFVQIVSAAGVTAPLAVYDGTVGLGGTFTATFTNSLGQSFETSAINVRSYDGSADADKVATDLKAALEALPNAHVPQVEVTAHYCEDLLEGLYTGLFAAGTGATKPGTGYLRCPKGVATGSCEHAVVLNDGKAWGPTPATCGGGIADGADVTLDAAVGGCTRIDKPHCIELRVKFVDPANTGPQNLLKLNIDSVTIDGATNAQNGNTDVSYTVSKDRALTYTTASAGYYPAGIQFSGTGTNGAQVVGTALAFGTGMTNTGTNVLPAGAKITIDCNGKNMGTFTVASVSDITPADSVTVTLASAVNDPSSVCTSGNLAGNALTVTTANEFIRSDVDWSSTDLASLGHGLKVDTTSLASAVGSLGTFGTNAGATGETYIFLADNVGASAVAYGAKVLTAEGTGTKEAEECSSRGNCDAATGLCQCYKGYTGARCDTQNALWVGVE